MLHYGPFKGIENAWDDDDFARFIAHIVGNGIYPNPSTNLQVMQNENMTVAIKPGAAWINGRLLFSDADLVLDIDNADGVLKRIDRVVIQVNYSERKMDIKVKKGTFASSPVAPSLQRNADYYELALADILINNGILEITQSMITDTRLNTELCGVSAGALQQVDTTTIFNQYQSFFNNWTADKQADFEAWLATLEDILDENVAANLTSQILALQQQVTQHLAHYASKTEYGHVKVGAGISVSNGIISVSEMTASNVATSIGSNVQTELNNLKSDTDNKILSVRDAIVSRGGTVTHVGEVPTASELVNGVSSIPNRLEPGTNYIFTNNASKIVASRTFAIVKEITINTPGTVRVRFNMQSIDADTTVRGQIHINGIPRGILRTAGSTLQIFTEDFTIQANDKIQLYGMYVSGSNLSFRNYVFEIGTSLNVTNTLT